jgi:hypothetical protein
MVPCYTLQDAGEAAKAALVGKSGTFNTIVDGKFVDERWAEGRWVISRFPTTKDGKPDWDKVRGCLPITRPATS